MKIGYSGIAVAGLVVTGIENAEVSDHACLAVLAVVVARLVLVLLTVSIFAVALAHLAVLVVAIARDRPAVKTVHVLQHLPRVLTKPPFLTKPSVFLEIVNIAIHNPEFAVVLYGSPLIKMLLIMISFGHY